jgi:hypothetical protein
MVRRRLSCLLAVSLSSILLGACGSSTSPLGVESTNATLAGETVDGEESDQPTDSVVPGTSKSSGSANGATILIGDIPLLLEGASDIATLSETQVCGLISGEALSAALGAKSAPGERSWSQDEGGSFCEQAYQQEFEGVETIHSVWGVERQTSADWPTTDADRQETASDLTLSGAKARAIVKTGEPGQAEESVRVLVEISPDRTLFAVVDSWPGADIPKAIAVAEEVFRNLKALVIEDEPPLDAKITSPMGLSAAQLCSLIREPALATLVAEGYIPGGDTLLLQGEQVSCGRGGSKLIVQIRRDKPFRMDDVAFR